MGRDASRPMRETDWLLLLVDRDAIDRLSFGVCALSRGGSGLSIGGDHDGLMRAHFPAPLARQVIGVRVDAFDRNRIPVRAVAGGRNVLAVELPAEGPLVCRPFRR